MEYLEIVADSVSQYGKPAGYVVAGVILSVKYLIPYLKKKWSGRRKK